VLFENGERLDIDHRIMGLGLFAYRNHILNEGLVKGDMDTEARVRQRVEAQTGKQVAEVRLEMHVYRAEDGQIVEEVRDRAIRLEAETDRERADDNAAEPATNGAADALRTPASDAEASYD
jgi:hypothetical protein